MRILTLFISSVLSLLIASYSDVVSANPALDITAEKKQILSQIRNNLFGGARIDSALRQASISGLEPPVFPYEVDNRGLIVWEINAEDVENFSLDIGLSAPFTLASVEPIRTQGSQGNSYRLKQFLSTQSSKLFSFLFPERYYVLADIGDVSRLEQGPKIEFKTFVRFPGDPNPKLLRFASFNALPGTDLLSFSTQQIAQIGLISNSSEWAGSLLSESGSLTWNVAISEIPLLKRLTSQARLSEAYLDASELTFSSTGTSAKYFYDGSSVSGKFKAVNYSNLEIDNSFSWAQYTKGKPRVYLFKEKSEFLVQPVSQPVAITPQSPTACVDISLVPFSVTNSSELFNQLVYCALAQQPPELIFNALFTTAAVAPDVLPGSEVGSLYFGLLDLFQGFQIFAGQEKPKLFFKLFADPKTIFINFEIRRDKVQDFIDKYLPENFELAKIKFYPEQRKPVHAVSLNVYQSSGQNLNGFRAEWSTYIINPDEEDPKPRFSVLEAQTNAGGFDPIVALERFTPGLDFSDPAQLAQLIEPPSDQFNYSVNTQNGIQIEVIDIEEEILLDVNIAYPTEDRILHTRPTTDWMEANDFVYWGKVADILKYDSNVMFADLLVFESQESDLIQDSTFADYVNPKPLPIIFWNNKQDIALEPWGNLEQIIVDD